MENRKHKQKASFLKSLVEEVEVQLNLGKKEAEDRFEEAQKKFKSFVAQNKIGETINTKLQEGLDELKVQTKLGEMEAKEKFNKGRKDMNELLNELSDKYHEAKKDGDEEYEKFLDKVDEEISEIRSKIDSFWLQVNLGKADAEDELDARRKELKAKLHELKQKWDEAVDRGEEGLDDLSKEMKKAFADYGDF